MYYTIKGNQDSALQILLPLYEESKIEKQLELTGDICSYIGRAYQHKNENKQVYDENIPLFLFEFYVFDMVLPLEILMLIK